MIPMSVKGHIRAMYTDTKEIILDTHNDVLYGNMSVALAHSLIGNPNSFLSYIGFGNGGAYVGPTGNIAYKPSLGGSTSLIKNPTANLYNTIYVKKLSTDATSASDYDQTSRAYIPVDNFATNYEDIVVNTTLGYNEPPVGVIASNIIQQTPIDNSSFIGTSTTITGGGTFNPGEFVFNEIGLFAGSSDLIPGAATVDTTEVDLFVAQTPNFSTAAGIKSKIMLTHAIFHPVQKAANRSLEFIYTLRIQMGAY